jgi:hypothetical protein
MKWEESDTNPEFKTNPRHFWRLCNYLSMEQNLPRCAKTRYREWQTNLVKSMILLVIDSEGNYTAQFLRKDGRIDSKRKSRNSNSLFESHLRTQKTRVLARRLDTGQIGKLSAMTTVAVSQNHGKKQRLRLYKVGFEDWRNIAAN